MNKSESSSLTTGSRVLIMAFLCNFTGAGIGFYGFGVFFKPLAEYFGSRGFVGMGLGLSMIMAATWAPRVGKAVDRWGPRPLMIIGSLAVMLSMMLLSFVTAFWQYLLIFGVVFSLARLHMGEIVTGSTVAKHFQGNPGRALGIATVGVSLSGVLIPPLAHFLLHSYGWRWGFRTFGLLAVIIAFLPAVFLLRGLNLGQDKFRGHNPDLRKSGYVPGIDVAPSITRSEAVRSIAFWKIVALFAFAFFPLGTMLVQLVPHLTDIGINSAKAALVLSITAGMGIVGKLAWGYVFDKIEGRYAIAASLGIQMLSLIWLIQVEHFWEAVLFGAAFGFGMGGMVPLHAAFRVRQFGAKHLGAIMGISNPVVMLAQAGGQPFSGWVFDTTGSYLYAFYIFLGCYIAGIAVALTIKDPDKKFSITD